MQKNKANRRPSNRIIKIVLMALIFLYPFVNSFLGIDLGDTGYHLYAFENLIKTPELIGFTSYFTTFVGYAWLRIFPGPELWGLNLLEVILEMMMATAVYLTLRKYLGDIPTLSGILVAVLASDTYLNIFNYHQFNVFWLILIMCFEFLGITKEKIRYSFLAGLCLSAVVFSRMGSITAVATLALYVVWFLLKEKQLKQMIKHVIALIIGAIIMTGCMLLLLTVTHQLTYFINNIFRLEGLATASTGGYSMNNLMSTFIYGNLDAIASGAIFLAAFVILIAGLGVVTQKCANVKKQIVAIIVGVLCIVIAIYQMVYAYNVNPVSTWPQMTTGPSFSIGVMYVAAFLVLIYHMFSRNRRDEFILIIIMAFALPLLTIAGSNTGTKHVILGMWIIAPVCAYLVANAWKNKAVYDAVCAGFEKLGMHLRRWVWIAAVGVTCMLFFAKFGHMLYRTTNFDSIDRTEYVASIASDKMDLLKTTVREAESINGVLAELNTSGDIAGRPLIVYGGSLMLYSLLDMPSYTQPWLTNGVYPNETLIDDFKKAEKKFDKLPIVIYCRTNNYYGFGEQIYSALVNSQMKNNYGGKREILLDFMDEHEYNLYYANDYYCLIYPPELCSSASMNYRAYMVYGWSEFDDEDADEDEEYDEDSEMETSDEYVDIEETEDAEYKESIDNGGFVEFDGEDVGFDGRKE